MTVPRTPAIYLDHQATTPLDERVLDAMLPFLREDFGNAASTSHVFGWRAQAAVEDARERVAAALDADPLEIVFTSGATESNNLAILGAARANRRRGNKLITFATEHLAVLDPVRQLEREGFEIDVRGVDDEGRIDLAGLADALDERTLLVSAMAANNEVGVLHPLAEIAALCAEHGALFHSDAAQAAGKIPLAARSDGIDLLSISGHKLYGPKGVGALRVRRRPRLRLEPILHGGGHERGLRSGTLPVASIVGLAAALDLCLAEREAEARRLAGLRRRLWQRLAAALPDLVLNGPAEDRLPGNLNVSIPGVDADKLLLALPDVALSTGSACSSADPTPSHVLLALGRDEALTRASLRFGLGRRTTAEQVERAADRVIDEARELHPAV